MDGFLTDNFPWFHWYLSLKFVYNFFFDEKLNHTNLGINFLNYCFLDVKMAFWCLIELSILIFHSTNWNSIINCKKNLATILLFLLLKHPFNKWLNLCGNHKLDRPPLYFPFHLNNWGSWPECSNWWEEHLSEQLKLKPQLGCRNLV